MLNFYTTPVSVFGQKVHYFLEEAGIPYKLHVLDLAKGEQKTPEYRRINPLAAVPAIEENGFSMAESNAILRYLAAKRERYDLYPANLEDRARVDALMEFTNLHVNRWMFSIAWNLHWAPMFGMARNDRAVDEARHNLAGNLVKLETVFAGRSYLAGAHLTLADVVLLPVAAQHKTAQVSLSDFPSFQAWVERMTDRPAWRKVMNDNESAMAKLRS